MNTNEQTANYICDNQERLQMALHVYEAMDDVRNHLIERVFQAVGEQVAEKLDAEKLGVQVIPYETGVDFHEETCNFRVYAEVSSRRHRQEGSLWLHAGLYDDAEDVDKARQEEIREAFKTSSDFETWSSGNLISEERYLAKAYVHHEGQDDRWDERRFLRRAILSHDETVSRIVELLVRIYEGVFGR